MWFCLPTPFLPNTLFERQTQKGSKMWRLWAKIQDRISRILKLATATIECPAMSFVFVTNENEKYKSVRRSSIWLSLGDDDQGPANTRYSTQTRNCLSYSNLARTKHYLDRVVSIINSRNSGFCLQFRPEWASTMRRTLSLSFKSWEESLLALNPLLFFIQHFPFLSDLMIKHNSRANFELF